MPSIDERVVSMAFENARFEQGIATTLASLKKLDDSLKHVGANQSLGDIEKSASKVTLNAPMSAMDKLRAKFSRGTETKSITDIERAADKVTLEQPGKAADKLQGKLDHLSAGSTFSDMDKAAEGVTLSGVSKAISNVTGQFSILQNAASVALGNIAAQAAMKGGAFAKSFAFGPLKQGFEEYSTNLNSIQTILANTEGQQVSGLGEVNKHLEELNTYSDQTIYNFGEMAKNIGTFTAAGVDMDKSTQSIKGIANLAALSGSNSQQASTAMYQLSQAIASGKVGLQDWNSVVNAGMGGAVFQKSLMRTAENMGALEKGAVKIDKATGKATINGESFRDSISGPGPKWLTSDVLTETLGQLTGDMSDAELKAKGFTDQQVKAIQAQAKTAKAAATEVKTLSQAFDVAKETIGSGWSKTFQLIFGDFNESKKTFTTFSTTLNGILNGISDSRNKMLGEWKELGGRTSLLDGLQTAFIGLRRIVITVHDAFRDVFPATTGKQLADLTESFFQLTLKLLPSKRLLANLQDIFGGVFAVMHIGFSIVKGLAGVLFDLIGTVGKGSGGILDFAGGMGRFLKSVDNALTKGGLLKAFFETLSNILKAPLTMISAIATAIFGMFGGADPEKAKGMGEAMQVIGDKIKPLSSILDKSSAAWEKLKDILSDVAKLVSPWIQQVADAFQEIGGIIADAIKSADFNTVLSALNTTFLGGLFFAIKKALGGGLADQLGGGILKDLGGIFKGLTGNLEAMQKNVQAKTLLTIAGAVAVLAGAVLVLSQIDPKKLSTAMTAVAVGLGEFAAAMALMGKMGTSGASVAITAGGMVLMATSMLILAGAVKIFSTMSWEDLAKGLLGVAGAMTAIGIGMKFLGPGTLVQGPALILIGIALNILAGAVKQFADMDWEELGKGLIGTGVALGLVAAAALLMPPNMIASGAGLILMATGMTFMVAAIAAMGALDPKVIAKGIIGVALAITALSVAIMTMPPTVPLQAAGLILLSVALTGIAAAIGIMGKLSLGTIVKGLITMGAALGILAVGMWLMIGTAPGAVALLAAAAAFAILAPAMALMGSMDWGTILKALATMALTLGVLAVVGTLAAAPLAVLGVALALLGVGLLVVVAPIYLLAKALSLLGSEGTKGIAVMVAALTAFVALLPKIVIDFVKGLVDIIGAVAEIAPKVVIALGIIIDSILLTVINAIPKLKIVITKLLSAFVDIIKAHAVPVISAGIALLLALLDGIAKNIGKVVDKGSEIIRKFLDGLSRNLPSILAAGLKTILKFLDGIANGIPKIVAKGAEIVYKFLGAVTAQIPKVVPKGAEMVVKFINGVASKIGDIVAAGTNLIVKFLAGLGKAIPKIRAAALDLARKFLNNLAEGMAGLADAGFKAIIKFLNGIERAIRENSDDLFAAGKGIADAIIDAIVEQFGKAGGALKKAIEGAMKLLPGWAKKILGIKSPSTVFADIGRMTMKGFSQGVNDQSAPAKKQMIMLGHNLIETFKGVFQIRSPSKVMRDIGKEVGHGFRDGLDGSKEDIRNSFKSIRERINSEMATLRSNIREEQKKREDLEKQHADKLEEIRKLKAKKKPDKDAIKQAQEDLKDIEKGINASSRAIYKWQGVLAMLGNTKSDIVGVHQASKQWLIVLSKQLDQVNEDLEDAKQKVADLKQEKDSFAKSIAEQFSKLPDFNKDAKDPVADYKQQLKARIEATKKFFATMKRLRELGLDEATFRKLLEGGIDNQAFADQLAAGGARGIEEINTMDQELTTISTQFGTQAASSLYDSGIKIAQGLVDGLEADKKRIEAVMEAIADSVVTAINNRLGIHSPSKVLAEVGKRGMQGLAQGFTDNANVAADAAIKAGDGAVSAMQKTISDMSGAIDSSLDIEPTITPVLDLTQVEKDAGALGDLTNVTPITAAASYGQATAISAEQAAAAVEAAANAQPTNHVELTQNNYSPESLPAIEIYRQTNNQMAQLKRVLGV